MTAWYVFGVGFGAFSFIMGAAYGDVLAMVGGMACFALNFLALQEAN